MGNLFVKEAVTYSKSLTSTQIFFIFLLCIVIFVLFPKRRQYTFTYNTSNHNGGYQNRTLQEVTNRNVNYESNITQQVVQLQRRNTEEMYILTKTAIESGNISFIIKNIWNEAELLNWEYYNYNTRLVHFVTLQRYSSEYKDIRQLFLEGTTKFRIHTIERIQNVYLLAAFLLKKEEMEQRYPSTPPFVEELFHGTKEENVMKICTENFNWRLFGKNEGNRFGKGVSFTPISHYATYYADEDSQLKVMFLANVLIGNECIGRRNMILPPTGFDTSIKESGEVIVKYEDNEFYPAYKITYYCTSKEEEEKRKIKRDQSKRYTKVKS